LQEWSQGQQRGLPTYDCQEVSQRHGDPRRFRSQVSLAGESLGEGWGGSRRQAEQEAARVALEQLKPGQGS
jgi:ribonuclease-3